jgi:hypothetical protein
VNKSQMMLKWSDEKQGKPISRSDAAYVIWKNRQANPALRIKVARKNGETYISSTVLMVGCCIYKDQ